MKALRSCAQFFLTLSFYFFLCLNVSAQSSEPEENLWYRSVAINGFVSGAYSYNFNNPESGLNQFRTFDFDDNSFKLDVAEIVFQKPAAESGEAGFRIDLTAGASVPKITAAFGLFRDPDTGESEDLDLQQAYVTYNFRGLVLDFGKYVTHAGAELIEGYDGFNNHYSHSYLFGFAIPFTHTGLRATYSFNEKVSTTFLLVNGWDNVKDNNDAKSIGFQIRFAPHSDLVVYANYVGGPEQTDNDSNRRDLLDFIVTYNATDRIQLAFNYDYGNEENVTEANDADWSGFAAYVRFLLSEQFALNLRGEFFNDDDGARTGVPQELTEFTITPEYRVNSNLWIRGDFRIDDSDQEVFEKNGEASDRQATIAVNAIYKF